MTDKATPTNPAKKPSKVAKLFSKLPTQASLYAKRKDNPDALQKQGKKAKERRLEKDE